MHRFSFSSSLLRRITIAAGVAAVGIALTSPTSVASVNKAKPVINTYKSWDGGSIVLPFGCPDSTTYGQTITVPAGKTKLTKFSFWMNGQAAAGQSMVARGEVYEWNGTGATGSALGESKAKTIAFGDADWHKVTFKAPSTVAPGQQYVVFASIDKDFESCTGNYTVAWGSTDGSVYTGGDFAFQNNTGSESNWTSAPWNPIPIDAATKIYMK